MTILFYRKENVETIVRAACLYCVLRVLVCGGGGRPDRPPNREGLGQQERGYRSEASWVPVGGVSVWHAGSADANEGQEAILCKRRVCGCVQRLRLGRAQ